MSAGHRAPPCSFADSEKRRIDLRCADGEMEADREDVAAALCRMYDTFEHVDRAQGIPPAKSDDRRSWVEGLLDGINVVAWHGSDAVGHAALLADRHGGHELAVFVHPSFRGVGIGTRTVQALLDLGRQSDVDRVWLSVARTNRPAVALYQSLGFETVRAGGPEMEMELELA
jgi:ribosomal protein S18 acetylase RimI-like enzyme